MNERQWCSGRTYHGRMGFSPCSNTPTSTHDGKPYCHVHDPVKAAARSDKANAKWRAECDAKDRQRKLADAIRLADAAVIEAAEDYIGKNMTEESLVENRWGHQPERIRLGLAVVLRRKALAEQEKEVGRAT